MQCWSVCCLPAGCWYLGQNITTYSQFSGLILINFTLELKLSEGNLELCYISRKLRMIVLIFIFKIDVQLFRINIKQFEDIQQAVDVEDKTCSIIVVVVL